MYKWEAQRCSEASQQEVGTAPNDVFGMGKKWTKHGGFTTWRLLRKKSDFVGRDRLPKWHPSGLENVSWHLVTAAGSLYQGSGTTKSGLFLAKIIRPIYNVIFEDRGHRCHRYLQCRLCL